MHLAENAILWATTFTMPTDPSAPLKPYFFASAAAALALLFVAGHIGYTMGRTGPVSVKPPPAPKSTVGKIVSITGATITIRPLAASSTLLVATQEIFTDAKTTFSQIQLGKDNRLASSTITLADLRSGDIIGAKAVAGITKTFDAVEVIVIPPSFFGLGTTTMSRK